MSKKTCKIISLIAVLVIIVCISILTFISRATADICSNSEPVTYSTACRIPKRFRYIRLNLSDNYEDEIEAEEPSEEEVLLYSEDDLEMLAIVIYQEAGGDACCDECRKRVGDIVLNRVADPRFPNTIEGVLTAKWQYGTLYLTGIKWPDYYTSPGERHAVERAYETARQLLLGNHSSFYGNGYIFQAEFPQGYDSVYCEHCHIYYGK